MRVRRCGKCAAFLNGGLNFQIKNSDFIKINLSVDSTNNDPLQQKVPLSREEKRQVLQAGHPIGWDISRQVQQSIDHGGWQCVPEEASGSSEGVIKEMRKKWG